MKAVQVPEHGPPEVCELIDVDVPTPGVGEVRIDVEAIGMNFADIVQRRGDYPGQEKPPYIPGREAAGRIEAVGADVDREVGERVVAFVSIGAFAEKVVADVTTLFDVPEFMSMKEAAGFPVQFLTAYHTLMTMGDIETGKSCLVHAAAGGVGTAAVQLANWAGAEIFATASTAEKLEVANDHGAHHLINYTESDFVSEIDDLTNGRGVDVVLESIGGEVFEKSIDVLAPFGRLVTYGFASGELANPKVSELLFGNKSVLGFHLRNGITQDPERILGAVSELSDLLASEEVRVFVGEKFPLADASKAMNSIENRASTGKVVLLP